MSSNHRSPGTTWRRAISAALSLFTIIAMFVTPLASAQATDPPTIASDKSDYLAGELVTLTGTGWTGDTTVNIVVNDTIDRSWQRDVDVNVDGDGNVTDSFNLPDRFISNYDVTATGNETGRIATTTFTDAPGDINKVYQHWADQAPAEWNNNILSATKSDYFEGEVIPHVFVYKASNNAPLTNGSSYSFNVTYNYYQANTNAGGFAYMTQFNLSRTPGPLNATNPYIPPSADSSFTNGGGMQAGKAFYTVDADITNVTAATYTGTGTKDGHVTITFTYTGTTTTNGIAEVYFGLFVSNPGQVPNQGSGTTKGAAAWTGGSLQTTVDIGGSGATSIQLNPDAIIVGQISGMKFNDLNGNGTKDQGDVGLAGWTIQLCADSACNTVLQTTQTGADGSYSFSVTPDADKSDADNDPYYVREVNQNGWTQTAPASIYYGPLVVSAATPQYLNQDFGNHRDAGSLKITKSLTGGPAGYTGPFSIHYSCDNGSSGDVSVAAGNSTTVGTFPTGTICTVTENALPAEPVDYDFGTPSYTDSSGTANDGIVTIVAGNTPVEVTVNNTLTSTAGDNLLKLAKSLTGGPAGYDGPFRINYDCDGDDFDGHVDVTAGSFQTVSGFPSGTVCTITETLPTPPTGYSFGTPTFTENSGTADDGVITIVGSATVTVTTNNTLTRDTGDLKLAKELTGGPAGYDGPFQINYDCDGTDFDGFKSVTAGSFAMVNDIPTGTQCVISETLPSAPTGYTFGTPSFSPSDTVTITTKDATVTVTTNNTLTRDTGSLKISKTLSNPDGASVPASFTVNYDCGTGFTGQVSVGTASPATVSGIPTGNVCTVTEVAPDPIPGYTWGSIVYTPTFVTISTKDGTFEITVGNSISRDTGDLKLAKELTGGPAGYDGPFQINYDCDGTDFDGFKSVTAGSFAMVNDIPTGTQCVISETLPSAPSGYTFGTPSFSPSDTVTITTKDATVTVTTNNTLTRDTGSLKISKTLSNPDGATVPASFTVNYDCGTGFTGQVSVGTASPATVSGIPTGNVCSVTEVAPAAIPGYTWGTITYTPASVTISTKDGTFEITVGNSITRDRGTIIIKKITKPVNSGSFAFTTTGTGYDPFTLGGGEQNSQTLPTGTYTVTEGTQLGWILTGIGGSTDPNTPYACTVTGTGGSTGSGSLATQTATIDLHKGDTVTCVFENTGNGATRTQGFWATHPQLANIAWFGGTAFNHTFPGVANTTGIGNTTLCSKNIDTLGKLMGGFWSSVSQKSTGGKRTALDQARMQLLQQLLAAELNASAFGSVPAGGSGQFAVWEAAFCGSNQTAIKNAQQGAASFNTNGDSAQFTPGTSADSKYARSIASLSFWDTLP